MNTERNAIRALILSASAVVGTLVTGASAANINWLGTASGDASNFNNAANWQGGSLPAYYNETSTGSGDVAVFDGAVASTKTVTMTAAFGNGVDNSAQWGLRGAYFVDSGWTFNTNGNTLYLSRQGNEDLRSEASSGVNTINGSLRLGARDTNTDQYSDVYVESGGTLRINGSVGVAVDNGGNTAGGFTKTGGGLLELNVSGGSWSIVNSAGTTRFIAETAGGVIGNGDGGLDSGRTLEVKGGVVDLNGAGGTVQIAGLKIDNGGEITNANAGTQSTLHLITKTSATINGLISGNIRMIFGANANETTTLSSDHTYTGTTTVSASNGSGPNTVVVTRDVLSGVASPFGNSTTAVTLGSSGGTSSDVSLLTNGAVDFGRDITAAASTNAGQLRTIGAANSQAVNSTFSGTITIGTASEAHIRVTSPAGVSVFVTGNIVESATAGNGALTKIGDGTVVLSGNNTYAGGTTVSTGTLLVNNTAGSGTGTAGVSVVENAVLGGFGSIAGNVVLSADSADVDALGGIIMPTSASNPLDIVGTLTADLGAALDLQSMTGLNPLATYTVVTYASLSGSLAVLNQPLTHDVQVGASSIQLVPVPEPTALALVGLAMIPVLRRRGR